MPTKPATVYLIGAGPGDPGLLTLRGRQCLERADVVLYDYLAGERLRYFAKPGARQQCLGRHGQGKLWTQPQINEAMVQAAQSGQVVARLKGGDPGVFGRLAEELDALIAAGVPFEIVPGVSSATAVAAYAGVTLTDRDQASCVTFVTGHEQADKEGSAVDFASLATSPGTLVIYMGVTTAEHWSGELIRHGRPAETPVLLVRRCSLPDQRTHETTLGEVAGLLAPDADGKRAIRPPLLAIVGDVARRRDAAAWFTGRPLFGQTVLVTRPEGQADAMADRLRELGAQVLLQPAIQIGPPGGWEAVDDATDRLAEFDWVVFSSSNGVRFFLDRLLERGLDARALGGCRLAAIGPRTAESLADYSLRADLLSGEYRAEALAEVLSERCAGGRVLLIRASRGREVLAEQLTDAGAAVEQVVVYQSTDTPAPDPDVAAALAAGEVDWTTATSSAIARSLVRLFGDQLRMTKLAAISPLTAGVLADGGFQVAATAGVYTADGLIDAMTGG
ncbi:MAG: uroporphyrinogen-III C-methyltransferase [Planctomycetota bacterium]